VSRYWTKNLGETFYKIKKILGLGLGPISFFLFSSINKFLTCGKKELVNYIIYT
jgi:hypothetical protein